MKYTFRALVIVEERPRLPDPGTPTPTPNLGSGASSPSQIDPADRTAVRCDSCSPKPPCALLLGTQPALKLPDVAHI
jgi:hypothetical protein